MKAPISSEHAPRHVKWSDMRETSLAMTRSHLQRSGTSMPKSFSQASA